jgi:hypothetical protein
MEAISDDYYEEMNFKFLISEYERAKFEKQKYMIYIEKIKNDFDFSTKQSSLDQHVKRLKYKEKEILFKINNLCALVGIKEPTIEEKIKQL